MDSNVFGDSMKRRKRLLDWLAGDGMEYVSAIAVGVSDRLKKGASVFSCGNGGSAAQAEHFAAELVGRFKFDRRPLSAHSLTTSASILTAVSNDYGFETVFARQLEGTARRGDCLLAISTSGESENVILACRRACEMGIAVYALTGEAGGRVAAESDVTLRVPGHDTPLIQEIHLTALHLMCEMIEVNLCAPSPTRTDSV